jgi:hypothetical protein
LNFNDLSIFSNAASFWCDSTLITSLDLSAFNNLEVLVCFDNAITFLDIRNGNNPNITLFDASSNSELECIFVDDAEAAFLNDWIKDNNSTFVIDNMECDSLSTEEFEMQTTIKVYPNPVINNLFIESNSKIESIIIYDMNGKIVKTDNFFGRSSQSNIKLNNLSKGVYFANVKTEIGNKTIRIVKQ